MDTQIPKKIDEKLDILTSQTQKVKNNIEDTKNQLDLDRVDIDRIRVSIASIGEQQDVIIKTMADFKSEMRQMVQDTVLSAVNQAVASAVKKELNRIKLANPKSVFIVQHTPIDWIKNIFKKHE